ncbi:MAG: trigger factor [Rhodothermales bacterium]|nr:trigger factor [Rhodothermales bacterium]
MDTKITQVSPVEYQLEITATADDLAPEFNKALKQQQARTTLKGFRPGKVPLPLVKKLVGRELAYSLADQAVQRAYEEEVMQPGEHQVLGQPTITELDYEPDGDLRAVVTFGVRPQFELADLSEATVPVLTHTVSDDELEEAIQNFLTEQADLVPVEDEAAGPKDYVVFDVQELDAETRTPVIGKRDEDQALFLDDERLEDDPMMAALRDALVGARPGDTVRFHFEHDAAHGEHTHAHTHYFLADVKEVKRRDLPELDDAFVEEATGGRITTVEAFRTDFRRQLDGMWERRRRELREAELMQAVREHNPIPVPPSAVEIVLDSFVEDVKRRNEGELPPNFREDVFREVNRVEAEQQARWVLLHDRIVEDAGLAVTDDDFAAFFEQEAKGDDDVSAEQLQQLYRQIPQLMDQLRQRLLSQKVFDWLAGQVTLEERDWETYRAELEARQQEA